MVRKRFADLERAIEKLRATIEGSYGKNADKAKMEKLLGELARMRAERLRLMDHQSLISHSDGGPDAAVGAKPDGALPKPR